jgi:adenosylcobinamide kinase/adenosylcobinamide-phosphate guanylyltransferase
MDLIIGGYAQNKVEYAKNEYSDAILYENLDTNRIIINLKEENSAKNIIINNLQLVIKEFLSAGMKSEEVWQEIKNHILKLEEHGTNLILISDEIGGGIVPMDAFDREWREVTGRILCRLAEQAQKVVRIVMGLPQIIKG